MAHQEEPMDIDSDFDNKENSLQYNNVLFTEKGYEEVDVSDLNMKLRYSVTPAASPMSKSYTATDHRLEDTENANITRSLYSTLNKNELKSKLPLQTLSSDGNTLQPQDSDNQNITITVDDDLSLPSSSSSAVPTPATTPTKTDGGSPIMRGLKSVLNMFRSSQSPIPPEEVVKSDILSPEVSEKSETHPVLASTPIAHRKEPSPSKLCSLKEHRESLTFNEDLEKELQWKDETTILFNQERIPIHKLFLQQPNEKNNKIPKEDFNTTVEYMDISQNDSIRDQTMTEAFMDVNTTLGTAAESDGEFVDCETTFTKTEPDDKDSTPVNKIQGLENCNSGSRLKQIILNTTQDILDATLSITPEDLLPEVSNLESVNTVVEDNHSVLSTTADPSETVCIENIVNDIEKQIKNVAEDIRNISADKDTVHCASFETTEYLKKPDSNFEQNIFSNAFLENGCDIKFNENLNLTTESCISNNTETIQVKSEHQQLDITETKVVDNVEDGITQINPTLEITETPMHEGDKGLNSTVEYNATLPALDQIEQCTNNQIPNQTVLDETNDTNTTQIIEERNLQPALELTIDIDATPDIVHEKTIQPIDQIVDIYATPIIMEDTSVQPILNQTIEISRTPIIVEEKAIQPILGQTVETICTPVMESATAETTITIADTRVAIQKDIIDIPTESTNLEHSIQELKTTTNEEIIQDLNTVIAIDENKESVTCKETKITDSNKDTIISTNIDNTNVVNMSKQLNLDSKPCNPKGEDESELPADVPLPDDDNLEDLSLPHNIVNDIKPESNESGKDCIQGTEEKFIQMNDGDKIDLTDVLPVIDTLITDGGGDNIRQQIKSAEQTLPNLDLSKEIAKDDANTNNNIELPTVFNESFAKLDHLKTCLIVDTPLTMIENAADCQIQPTPEIVNETSKINIEQIVNTREDITNNQPVELQEHIKSDNIPEICNALKINNFDKIDDTQTVVVPAVSDVSEENTIVPDKNYPSSMNIDQSVSDYLLTKTDTIKGDTQGETVQIDNTPEKNDVTIEIKPQDEEITVSGNNSPFVAVAVDDVESLGEKENDTPKSRVLNTPPASPPISSKGYNFNFDEIDDPFATKTKIRLSPSSENINKNSKPLDNCVKTKKEINNRRKSQPARKPVATRKKFNSTFDSTVSDEKLVKEPKNQLEYEENRLNVSLALEPNSVQNNETMPETALEFKIDTHSDQNEEQPITELDIEMNQSDEINTKQVNKSPSSLEQSAYYSAGASSVESTISKNVFNLPEIDDRNFNPFATKTKVCVSSPPSINIENPFETKSKINSSFASTEKDYDKMETEAMEKDVIANLSNNSTSSKVSDENHTVREINTEDEDTAEGPFFEADDVIDDRLSDCDSESNMMQFKKPFHRATDDQTDSGELFIDAEAFEFLLNQNKCNTVVDSGKESLFLKFDPLFAKRMSAVTSDSVLAALSKVQKRERTPTKLVASPKQHSSSIPGPSNLNVTQDLDLNSTEEFNDELNITVSKPMMVVPPAVNPVTPRNKSLTPNRSSRRSITFTSPAMAVIDRLLSLSGNNNSLVHDTTVTQPSREHNEADLVLSQLRDLLAEKEISVYNLRSESRELQDRLCSMESQVKSLETECQARLQNINDLNNRLAEKTKINKSMAAVVEEYERTIASLISETAQDKKRHAEERMKLISERDEQTAHLASMEVSFSDLHSKYEKSKQVILNCKANEDTYKKSIKEFEENLTKMQTNYELLKQHATSKLNHANQELEKINKSHEAEVLKLNAMIKRKELHITSLEETLAQKTKANEELTAICDELINKVG